MKFIFSIDNCYLYLLGYLLNNNNSFLATCFRPNILSLSFLWKRTNFTNFYLQNDFYKKVKLKIKRVFVLTSCLSANNLDFFFSLNCWVKTNLDKLEKLFLPNGIFLNRSCFNCNLLWFSFDWHFLYDFFIVNARLDNTGNFYLKHKKNNLYSSSAFSFLAKCTKNFTTLFEVTQMNSSSFNLSSVFLSHSFQFFFASSFFV